MSTPTSPARPPAPRGPQPGRPNPARRPPPGPPPPPPKPSLELYVEEGDDVLWFAGADEGQAPFVGKVTRIGLEAVTVNRFSPEMCDTSPQDGVRHVSDPRARMDGSAGGWRHKVLTVACRKLLLAEGLLEWALTPRNEWALRVVEPRAEDGPAAEAAPVGAA